MKSRWRSIDTMESTQQYLALASLIPPRSIRSTGALFRGSRLVTRQMAEADGVIGFALLAEPFRKRYATLSVWRDEEALSSFAHSTPHRALMAQLAPAMAPTRFVRWTIEGADTPPTWSEALDRLRRTL